MSPRKSTDMSYLTVAIVIFCLVKLLHGVPQLSLVKEREAFFNGTSYIRLSPLNIRGPIGFSFRSCAGGQLFVQSSSTYKNKISLEVTTESLTLSIMYSSKTYETKILGQFLDNQWHNVEIVTNSGNIILSVEDRQQIVANFTYHSEVFNAEINLFDRSSKLTIGDGFYGCLIEGPSLMWNSSLEDFNIEWGTCPLLTGPCLQDYCANEPCMHGVCFSHGDRYECICDERYSGNNCEIENYEKGFLCDQNTCAGEAECREDNGSSYCVCKPGFTGQHPNCTEITSCSQSPCLNDGICNPVGSSDIFLNCTCPPGFTGKLCQHNVDECHPPCQHNGTCVLTTNGYACNCTEGYKGAYCEEDIDECKLNVCKHGHCLNSDGGYQCFCTPGYTGDHCELDIDECLSHPCFYGATCINAVNRFHCNCTPGYTGRDCRINIDECVPNPCLAGGTCIDGNNSFTCQCPVGLTGLRCEQNIDDCASLPCQNSGKCIDGINNYTCDCSDTGFVGEHCESNINDCLSNPCKNNATCLDLVKDYLCECFPGYEGKNCDADINECDSNPCQYGGTCWERSNQSLYNKLDAPFPLPSIFNHSFSYANAHGYECICSPGLTGNNCEININECESNPCKFGKCIDGIGGFTCECEDGYDGIHCDIDIDECDRYKPCVHGNCLNKKADWFCECPPKYGGKNCSVELIGCNQESTCLHNGTCKPYLIGETQHKFNCTCPSGFHGAVCEKITTMSLNGESHIVVNTTRDEGYDISFRFKTTLPSGLLALGKGSTFYILELYNGRLNLHSSLLNKWEGVFIGSQLNDSSWQKVFVAINSSHVVLAANEEQTIYPINLNEAGTANQTSFPTTYVGGTVPYLRHLTHGPSVFIGCTENIVINGQWVIPEESTGVPIEMQGVEVGCQRRDQCHPNPCHSDGMCTDLWKNFSCSCPRPYLGNTCQYNLTAATFGHENISNSLVTVTISNPAKKAIRNIVDISMFIRTRQSKGAIFYLGSFPGSVIFPEETYIAAELDAGELLIRIHFNGTTESYSVGGVKLNDGKNHLIQIVRNFTVVQAKINGTEYFRKTISASGPLDAPVLYIGGFPAQSNSNETIAIDTSTLDFYRGGRDAQITKSDAMDLHTSRYIRQTIDKFDNIPNFKGVIQDVQISNGSLKMVVEFFPINVTDLVIPKYFTIAYDKHTVLEGVLSDDTCRSNPCLNNANCTVTWNDYICHCPHGYKGKQCQEMEFCQVKDCPVGSECRNLDHGYECVANITMNGLRTNSSLQYSFVHNTEAPVSLNSIEIMYRSKTGGTLLYLSNNEEIVPQKHLYFSVFVYNDTLTMSWKLDSNSMEQIQKIKKEHPDGEWTNIVIKITDNKIHGSFLGSVDEPGQYFSSSNFSSAVWNNLVTTGTIYIGGGDGFLEETLLASKFSYVFDVSGNTVESATTELISSTSGPSIMNSLSGHASNGIFYRGCVGEVRIGGLLLPYFTPKQLKQQNDSILYRRDYFELRDTSSPVNLNCSLCFATDCHNGGKCLNPYESYSCKCSPGFDGEDCSHDVDECLGNKCQHGATCVDGIANYTCQCTTGWSGWLCDIDIDECLSQPCHNNGTCIDNLGYYLCKCTDEFVGKQCEHVKIITCENKPCKNDAHCSDTPNKNNGDNFTCSCLDGFIGTYCHDTFCSVTPCRNKGLCVIKNKAPMCECSKGFTGKYCEENIDDCQIFSDGPPCLHNGRCIDGIDSYICNCSNTGYRGAKCEIDINECEESRISVCGDRGKCKNTNGGYECECDINVCGHHCDLYDPCVEMPCQNGGTCHEKCTDEPDYECACPPDFVGKNCTEVPLYSAGRVADIALIVGPIALILLLGVVVSLVMLFMMARNKRATRGTYSPSSQEYCNPRVELDNVMKPPPEERLI